MKYFPDSYKSVLSVRETERAIKLVKDTFERELSGSLRLSRFTSPLFVKKGSGINDDLNGIERPVSFEVGKMNDQKMEIVQSLAKWKRMALSDYGVMPGSGLYTDMNALRPDDDLDAIHSIYVDQWDWELVIEEKDRNLEFLKKIVSEIYSCLRRTEFLVHETYTDLYPILPENITFIHTEDAKAMYPNSTDKEIEYELSKKYKAIFLIGIGGKLADGKPHSGRAPDYDDWSTETKPGYKGLNGDLIVFDEVRGDSLELSSMGIRVNKEIMLKQLAERNMLSRLDLYWHKRLMNGEFPQTIGGGIGQSRLCMFLLKKAHIGEVQASVWPDDILEEAKSIGLQLM